MANHRGATHSRRTACVPLMCAILVTGINFALRHHLEILWHHSRPVVT